MHRVRKELSAEPVVNPDDLRIEESARTSAWRGTRAAKWLREPEEADDAQPVVRAPTPVLPVLLPVMPEALEVARTSSSSCMVPHPAVNVLAVEETGSERTLLTSFEDLKEAHPQERLALRQQSRHERNLRMARCVDPEPDT